PGGPLGPGGRPALMRLLPPLGKTPPPPGRPRPRLRAPRSTRSDTPTPGADAARANCGPDSRPGPVPVFHLGGTVPPPTADAPASVAAPATGAPAARQSTTWAP